MKIVWTAINLLILAASTISIGLATDTGLYGTPQAASRIPFQKPREMTALSWIQHLETERTQAEVTHQFDTFEDLTREISATLAGKYGLANREATPEEALLMLSCVVRTRDTYVGKPDILNDFYFTHDKAGCWRKIEQDTRFAHHMAVIAASDAIRWGLVTERPLFDKEGKVDPLTTQQDIFAHLFRKQRQQNTVDQEFTQTVTHMVADIHDDEDEVRLKRLMARLSQESWQTVVAQVGAIGDITAPSLDFLDIMAVDYAAFEDKGWDAHKVGQFAVWLRDNDAYLKHDKQAFIETTTRNPKRFKNYIRALLKPMTSRAVLLTPQNKHLFPDMPSEVPFNGTTLAIEYRFFPPLLRGQEGGVILPHQSFYLTRKLVNPLLRPLLSGLEHIQQRAQDYQGTVLMLHRLYFEDFYVQKLTQNEKMAAWQKATTLGSLIAYNNYGLYLEERNLAEAANYYKAAADRGLSTSIRNILFWLKEKKGHTPETDRQINRYLKMGGLFGEFSNTGNNFASGLLYEPPGLEELFKDVTFEGAQPHCIKLKKRVDVKDGYLGILFRDSTHLKSLIEETPFLDADRIYFRHDEKVEIGDELYSSTDEYVTKRFIHVMGDTPLRLVGSLKLGCGLVLPRQSDFRLLGYEIKSGGLQTSIAGYKEALALANVLEDIDLTGFESRTQESRTLLQIRQEDRSLHPENYPNFEEVYPYSFVCSNGPVNIYQDDFLSSKSPIIYLAPNLESIEALIHEFNPFTEDIPIYLIDETLDYTGVYSKAPLCLDKGFVIEAEKDLVLGGLFHNRGYNFKAIVKESYWFFANLHAKSIYVRANNLSCININLHPTKPEGMPGDLWQAYRVHIYKTSGRWLPL